MHVKLIFVHLPIDSTANSIMFLDCPIRLFIWSGIVTMISHERLEQFW